MKMQCGNCQVFADSTRKVISGKDKIARHCHISKEYVEADNVVENCASYVPRKTIWCRKLDQFKPAGACARARKDPEYPLYEACSRCTQGNMVISGLRFHGFKRNEKKGLSKFKKSA